MPATALANPFLSSADVVMPSVETAVAPDPITHVHGAAATFDIQSSCGGVEEHPRQATGEAESADVRQPAGIESCPQEATIDHTDCIGEIFIGARKLIEPEFDPAAINEFDEILYWSLKAKDRPETRDLAYIPDRRAFWEAIEPMPLFLERKAG